ncbi:MAG: imelysin family protein, partial [Myxococcota bacterium]
MKTSYLRHISLGPLLWLAACGGDDGTTTPPAPSLLGPLEATMDATILPALDQMATEATAARTAAEAMCSAPDEARLTALQDSWRDLYEAYNRAGAYGFGPLDDDPIVPRIYFIDPMRQRGTDYTETVRATLTQALTDPTMLTADDVDALTFNRVGLIALEVLSFEATTSSQSTAAANIVAQLGDADACTYLTGVARGLESRSQAVAEEWKTPSADGPSFRDRMATANLPDGSDPVATLLLG